MVVLTRSQTSTNMTISQEFCDYFEVLIQPLATNQALENMFARLKDGIVSKFDEKISTLNNKINVLEGKVAVQQKTIELLSVKCDDNEQYSRRNCLRIHGIQAKDNEI